MPVRVKCPTCEKTLQVPDSVVGKRIRCPNCEGAVQVEPVTVGRTTAKSPTPARVDGQGSKDRPVPPVQQRRRVSPPPRRKKRASADCEEEYDENGVAYDNPEEYFGPRRMSHTQSNAVRTGSAGAWLTVAAWGSVIGIFLGFAAFVVGTDAGVRGSGTSAVALVDGLRGLLDLVIVGAVLTAAFWTQHAVAIRFGAIALVLRLASAAVAVMIYAGVFEQASTRTLLVTMTLNVGCLISIVLTLREIAKLYAVPALAKRAVFVVVTLPLSVLGIGLVIAWIRENRANPAALGVIGVLGIVGLLAYISYIILLFGVADVARCQASRRTAGRRENLRRRAR